MINIKEILCLLCYGYPDGALSRARNVYEQMVNLKFIAMYQEIGEHQDIVERYFADYDVQIHIQAYPIC